MTEKQNTRLIGIGREQPTREERLRGEQPPPHLAVAVGKSERLRLIPLSEKQLLALVTEATVQLERLRKEREKQERGAA